MPESLPPETVAAALVLFRVSGLLLVAPIFGSLFVPRPVRAGLAILMTVTSLPAVAPPTDASAIGAGAFVAEMVVGLGIGLGALTLLAGAELAGEVLGVQTGLSSATALDPLSGHGTSVLSQLLHLLVVLLILVSGGHLYMIEALASSFAVAPVGAVPGLEAGATELVRMAGLLFAHGLQFAAPIIVASFVGYAALGALARAAPQLNVLAVAFPLQIGLGLFVLAGVLPFVAAGDTAWPMRLGAMIDRFLAALSAG
jgi:flagellar biosynthetic protein FliR